MKRVFFDRLRLGRFQDGSERVCLDVLFADADGDEFEWTPGWDDLCELASAAYRTEYSNEGENQHTRRLATAIYWSERGRRRQMKRREWGRNSGQEYTRRKDPKADALEARPLLPPNPANRRSSTRRAYCIECDWHYAPDACPLCDWCGVLGEAVHQLEY